MLTLFPPIRPYKERQLKVSSLHSLYIEESGNPHGIPIVFLHGGPGGGAGEKCRRFFNPKRYRIILFDQRGCGRSTPHAELEENTTQDLVADLEKIREALNIEQWMIFGGSWGSTLGLIYAQHYPKKILGMILRGISLCREEDFQWFYHNGAPRIFPDHWDDLTRHIPKLERNNLIAGYHKILTGDDDVARMSAAKAWSRWEAVCSTLEPCRDTERALSDPHVALAMAKIECHYFVNKIFLEKNTILKNMPKIANIPGIIVHGRYDMVCPLDGAYAINAEWPESELNIIRDAGHSMFEPAIIDALVRATNDFAR